MVTSKYFGLGETVYVKSGDRYIPAGAIVSVLADAENVDVSTHLGNERVYLRIGETWTITVKGGSKSPNDVGEMVNSEQHIVAFRDPDT